MGNFSVSIKNCLKFFVETGNAKEAIQLLPFGDNSVNIERTLLMELAKSSNAYKAAILALPRDVRTMYELNKFMVYTKILFPITMFKVHTCLSKFSF
jgi:hypothetical protein